MLGVPQGSKGPGWVSTEAGGLPVENITHWKPLDAPPEIGSECRDPRCSRNFCAAMTPTTPQLNGKMENPKTLTKHCADWNTQPLFDKIIMVRAHPEKAVWEIEALQSQLSEALKERDEAWNAGRDAAKPEAAMAGSTINGRCIRCGGRTE